MPIPHSTPSPAASSRARMQAYAQQQRQRQREEAEDPRVAVGRVPPCAADAAFDPLTNRTAACRVCWTIAIGNVLNYHLKNARNAKRVATKKLYNKMFPDQGYHTYAPISRAARTFFTAPRAVVEMARIDRFAGALAGELAARRLPIIEVKTINQVGHALTVVGFRSEALEEGRHKALLTVSDAFYGASYGSPRIEVELFRGEVRNYHLKDPEQENVEENREWSVKTVLGLRFLDGNVIEITGATLCGEPREQVLAAILADR